MRLVREQALLLGDFVKATQARHTKRHTKATGRRVRLVFNWKWRASTSCKTVETLPQRNDLPCFKSLLVPGLWDIILTSLLPPIQSFEHGFVLLAILIRGGGGSQAQDHGQAIYAKIRYSVSSTFTTGCCSQVTMRPMASLWNRNTYITCKIKTNFSYNTDWQ